MTSLLLPRILPRSSLQARCLAPSGHPTASVGARKVRPRLPARLWRTLPCQRFPSARLACRLHCLLTSSFTAGALGPCPSRVFPLPLPRASRACRLAFSAVRAATVPVGTHAPSLPAPGHRTSHRQHCRQEVQSERAGSLMTHFAWPSLLPRSLFQRCLLALSGHPAANVAANKFSPSVPARL